MKTVANKIMLVYQTSKMIVYRSSKNFKKSTPSPVVAIGNFDGVHLGHQMIFREVIKTAKKIQGTSVVYTFDPPPTRVLHPEKKAPQINSLDERVKLIEKQGIENAVIEQFTHEFSQKSAQQFFDQIVLQNLTAKVLYVGYNFFFGKNREGTPEVLKALCQKNNIELHVMESFKIKEEPVSSSKIRSLILEGNVKKASEFLGRHFFIHGTTIQGAGRGKKIGVPTANLKTTAELIPKSGVYITLTFYKNALYPSVTNVGPAPTFNENNPFAIETHLLDFNEDLYGKPLMIYFVDRIRDVQKFSSIETLVEQIKADILKAKQHFKKYD